MLTSNYNVVQCSAKDRDKYEIGQRFVVPKQHRHNSRFMRFDGLLILDITFGFGVFLHFDYFEWENSVGKPEFQDNIPKPLSYLF